MKRKKQVLRYISKCRFSDDDWQKVLDWCRNMYGGGYAHRAIKPISESTFSQFLEWNEHGLATGDVVNVDGVVGILGDNTPKISFLSAFVASDNKLVVEHKEIQSVPIKLADKTTTLAFYGLLRKNKLRFSYSLSDCVKAWYPANGDFVRVNDGKKVMYGICNAFIEDNCSFSVLIDGKKTYYNQSLSYADLIFYKATKTEIDVICHSLEKDGFIWNKAKQCIEKAVAKSRNIGGTYWYMSEQFSPCMDYDKSRKIDDRRYAAGNYFNNIGYCLEFCKDIIELRKKVGEI